MDTTRSVQIEVESYSTGTRKKFTLSNINPAITREKVAEFAKKTVALTKNTYMACNVIETTRII